MQAAVKGELWRLRDPTGKPPGVMGWWPSRAVTFIENHDTGSTQGHWPFPSSHVMEVWRFHHVLVVCPKFYQMLQPSFSFWFNFIFGYNHTVFICYLLPPPPSHPHAHPPSDHTAFFRAMPIYSHILGCQQYFMTTFTIGVIPIMVRLPNW